MKTDGTPRLGNNLNLIYNDWPVLTSNLFVFQGFDERIGEKGNPGERRARSRRRSHPPTPSSLQVRRGVHDCTSNSVALASAVDSVPRDALATRGRIPQLLR